MAILRSWFNGSKDFDVPEADVDELFGRARELVKACRTGLDLNLEIELDSGRVLHVREIIEILIERESELQSRPQRR